MLSRSAVATLVAALPFSFSRAQEVAAVAVSERATWWVWFAVMAVVLGVLVALLVQPRTRAMIRMERAHSLFRRAAPR